MFLYNRSYGPWTVETLLQSFLLLAMRLYWGYLLIQAGLGKFINAENSANFFENLNIPFPLFTVYLVGSIEAAGGLCLMLGLASRIASLSIIIIMIGAYATAFPEALMGIFQDPAIFISKSPFLYMLTALFVLAFGPGYFSMDYLLSRFYGKK